MNGNNQNNGFNTDDQQQPNYGAVPGEGYYVAPNGGTAPGGNAVPGGNVVPGGNAVPGGTQDGSFANGAYASDLSGQIPDPSLNADGAVFGAEAFGASEYGRRKAAAKSGTYENVYSSSPTGFEEKRKSPNRKQKKQEKKQAKAQKKQQRGGSKVIFRLSLLVMIAALLALGVIAAGYIQGCVMYKNLADDVLDIDDNDGLNITKMKVDWNQLLAINPDTVAWVYVPGTHINYPVVHTTNNDKYLHTSFRGERSYISYGAIFADCNNKHDLSDQNIVTYGHNMNDGSMYGDFAEFRKDDVLNAHKDIYFLTPQGNYKLTAFTCCHISGGDPIVQVNFSTQEKMNEYINDKIARGVSHLYGNIPSADKMKKIFTFSTCDNQPSNGRYVTFAFVSQTTVPGVTPVE